MLELTIFNPLPPFQKAANHYAGEHVITCNIDAADVELVNQRTFILSTMSFDQHLRVRKLFIFTFLVVLIAETSGRM